MLISQIKVTIEESTEIMTLSVWGLSRTNDGKLEDHINKSKMKDKPVQSMIATNKITRENQISTRMWA